MNIIKKYIIRMSVMAVLGFSLFIYGIFYKSEFQSMGIAMLVVSLIKLVKFIKLYKNKEEAEKFINLQNDERTIFISRKSYASMFWISIYIEFIVSLYFSFANQQNISNILYYIICIQLLASVGIYYYNNKRY